MALIMNPPSLCQTNVPWQPGGVKPAEIYEHSRYIDDLCDRFVEGVKMQVCV